MRMILPVILLVFSINCFSQTCEEKEIKLTRAVNGFSSAVLYNTYGLIGSVADAYVKDAYTSTTVTNLMDAQKTLADNLIAVFSNLITDSLVKPVEKDYVLGAMAVLEGLKIQAGLLQDFSRAGGKKKQAAYEEQRDKNWSAISRLMGIKE